MSYSFLSRLFLGWVLCFVSLPFYLQSWEIEAKAGIFIPSDKKIKRISHSSMPLFEVEGKYCLGGCWNGWAGIGYIFDDGRSLGCHDKTTFNMIPISLGLERRFCISKCIIGSIGVGGVWSFYNNHDHSCFVHKNVSNNGVGAIFKGNLQYRLCDRIYLSIFAEYLLQRFSFRKTYHEHFTYRHDVDLSGTKLGIGILYAF